MQYTNVKVPAGTAWLDTDQDIFDMLATLVGGGCEPSGEALDYDASIGRSAYGPWVEGDVGFTRDGHVWALAYDFMVFGDVARVFRFDVTRTDG